ncbi:hypothetical protein DNTS_003913 [Danionella cerebrum]|uniref:Uncharacterized protein n=1 Tax=Danionella cerebrum TaxID=2873325 RepID=A0A553Q441_9TELE|nr:hypothetical protein DNTS_003913 [Danionella translucida]
MGLSEVTSGQHLVLLLLPKTQSMRIIVYPPSRITN